MQIDYERRIFGLDLVRSIAILLVLVSHSTILLFPDEDTLILTICRFLGTIGVDLFFVLSGFLIGSLIVNQMDSGKTEFKHFLHFWVRRWFRTLPNYYLILVINVGLYLSFHDDMAARTASYFVFLQNFMVAMPDFFTESWSLTIEEFSYLLGPLLMFVLIVAFPKRNRQVFLVATLVLLALGCYLRYQFHSSHQHLDFESWSHGLRKVVIYRIDSIYYGFMAAYFAKYHSNLWTAIKYPSLIFGSFLFVLVHGVIFYHTLEPANNAMFFNLYYLPILLISLLCVFPMASKMKECNHLLAAPIRQISLLAFALYLVNYSIILLTMSSIFDIASYSGFQKFQVLILFWFLTFVSAYVLYRYYEYPMMKLRDHPWIKKILRL